MIKKTVLFLSIIISLYNCSEKQQIPDKKFTLQEIEFNCCDFQPDVLFWDVFPEYKEHFAKYKLKKVENLLGQWRGIEDKSSGIYFFFPNTLFTCEVFSEYTHNAYIERLIGTWEIRKGSVFTTIYGYITCFQPNPLKLDFVYYYHKCKPYSVKLIQLGDLTEYGYSKQRFDSTPFPEDMGKKIIQKNPSDKYESSYKARVIYTFNVLITNKSGELKKKFHDFKIIPDIVENDWSAMDLINNGEMLTKLLFEKPDNLKND